MVLAQAAPGHWLTWGRFPDAVRSGTGQMKAAHGTPGTIFDYLAAHPDEASHFTEAMSNLSAAAAIEIAKVVDTLASIFLEVGWLLSIGRLLPVRWVGRGASPALGRRFSWVLGRRDVVVNSIECGEVSLTPGQ